MFVTREEAENIAHLACLNFTDSELEKITEQLNQILGYMNKLDEIDTSNIEPLLNPLNLSNAFRKDKMEGSLNLISVFLNAPKSADKYFVVPRVIKK